MSDHLGMEPSNPWARFRKRLEALERLVKANASAPIRNASIDGPVTISHRGAVNASTPAGGMTALSPDGVVSTGADGTGARTVDGVNEVRSGPEDPWMPLEQVILDQVPPPSDGLVPTAAPDVEVVQQVGAVYLKLTAPPNPDPIVAFNVYVDGVFAQSSSATTVGVIVDGAGAALPYDADSVFTVSASDADGEGPLSGPVAGRPLKVASVDIAQGILDDIDAAGTAADAAQADADQALADALAAAAAASAAQSTANAAETPAGAQTKANTAQSNAISTAAADALSKANAAQTAATAAAAADALAKANAARDAAIASASGDATSKANAAQSAATAAAAADALTKANAARDAAVATANGYADTQVATKGKIIAQNTAPSGANQNVNNLWINTTGGANTPNRWDGSNWVTITDKVASDAATAAFNAQTTANSAATAAATAQTSANGKNRVIYSAADPSTNVGGIVDRANDTWFKNVGGLIVGQWQHNGTTWVPVQLENVMIANLDAGKITTGFLNVATLLQAGAITADKFAATLALVSTLQAGGNVTISPPTNVSGVLGGGIVVADPTNPGGEPLVRLHPDGCTFKGKVITDILTVMQDLIINGTASLSSGAVMNIKNGVADPIEGPIWSQGPSQAPFPAVPTDYYVRGMAWDATNQRWIRLIEYSANLRAVMEPISVAGVSSGGTILGQYVPPGATTMHMSGVTVQGASIYYVSQTISGIDEYYNRKTYWTMNKCRLSDGVLESGITLATFEQDAGETPIYQFYSLGSDASYVYASDGADIRRWPLALPTTADSGRAIFSDGADTKVARSLDVGDRGYGASKITFGYNEQAAVYSLPSSWTGETVTRDTSLSWNMDSYINTGGLAYKTNGTNQGFYSHHSDQKISRWSSYYPTSGEKFWGKYLDFVGALHTAASSVSSIAVIKRRFAFATLRPAPGGVTGSELYVGYGSSAPANYYKRPETISGRVFSLLSGKDTSGTSTVPSGNNAGGTPGRIQSEVGGLVMRGDGTGGWPLQDPKASFRAQCSANTTVSGTSGVTIPGKSVTVTSTGTSNVFLITASFDIRYNAAGTANLIVLYVDGVSDPRQIVTNGASGQIQTASKSWLVTGLAAGNHTFTFASANATSSNVTITANSEMQVVKL